MIESEVNDPKDPRLVDDLIASARKRPDGIELLRDGYLGSVAMIFSVHAFTVEAARARLQSDWGCPIEGPTRLEDAVAFTKRFLEIGADDIEHADHDGSAPPNRVYDYYSMILDAIPDPSKHVAHFHVTRGWGLANVLAALQAGIVRYESTLGGIGGQPANFFDGAPVAGTGSYYYQNPNNVGLVCTEDMVVMLDEMGIETGVDVDRVLATGRMTERIVGRRLRSETVKSGRIPKQATDL